MNEHAKIRNIDNTEDLREKPEAKKITEEREFTISRKITVVAECIVIASVQGLYFFIFYSYWKRIDIYVFDR